MDKICEAPVIDTGQRQCKTMIAWERVVEMTWLWYIASWNPSRAWCSHRAKVDIRGQLKQLESAENQKGEDSLQASFQKSILGLLPVICWVLGCSCVESYYQGLPDNRCYRMENRTEILEVSAGNIGIQALLTTLYHPEHPVDTPERLL